MFIFLRADMSMVDTPRSYIKGICVRINHGSLRRWSWRYHPFPACDLGFEEAISQHGYHRDRIEDDDEQHHGVGHGAIHSVIRDGYHDLETNPVQQRRHPVEFRVPWPPKPIGSTRRWRACLICSFNVINILHLQSLSIWKNNTGSSDWKPIRPDHRGPIAHGHRKYLAPSFPPPLHRALFYGSTKWIYFKSWTRPR